MNGVDRAMMLVVLFLISAPFLRIMKLKLLLQEIYRKIVKNRQTGALVDV